MSKKRKRITEPEIPAILGESGHLYYRKCVIRTCDLTKSKCFKLWIREARALAKDSIQVQPGVFELLRDHKFLSTRFKLIITNVEGKRHAVTGVSKEKATQHFSKWLQSLTPAAMQYLYNIVQALHALTKDWKAFQRDKHKIQRNKLQMEAEEKKGYIGTQPGDEQWEPDPIGKMMFSHTKTCLDGETVNYSQEVGSVISFKRWKCGPNSGFLKEVTVLNNEDKSLFVFGRSQHNGSWRKRDSKTKKLHTGYTCVHYILQK